MKNINKISLLVIAILVNLSGLKAQSSASIQTSLSYQRTESTSFHFDEQNFESSDTVDIKITAGAVQHFPVYHDIIVDLRDTVNFPLVLDTITLNEAASLIKYNYLILKYSNKKPIYSGSFSFRDEFANILQTIIVK